MSVLASTRRGQTGSLADVDFKTIAGLVNSGFVMRDLNGDSHSLELIQAESRPSTGSVTNVAGAEGSESFSLVFRGDATRPLDQNTYSFEHARIGRFVMFIVPIGRECGAQCRYEAVFNRPPPEPRPPGRFVTLRRNR